MAASVHEVLPVARTIADLDGEPAIAWRSTPAGTISWGASSHQASRRILALRQGKFVEVRDPDRARPPP